MVGELVEARLDELLHRRGLVNDALHHVVDRLDLHRCRALAQLFLCGCESERVSEVSGSGADRPDQAGSTRVSGQRY